MAEHFKIVFEGHLRNGVELETAKLNLAQLFKTDVTAVDRLFRGNPVTVKRGLTHDDAERYLKALNDAGVEARVEPEVPISLAMEEIEDQRTQGQAFEPPATSPYAPPRAAVSHDVHDVGELHVFTVQGRIGRLRYLAWTMVLMFVALILFALCMTLMSMSLITGGLFGAVAFVVFLVVSIQVGAQRLHDAVCGQRVPIPDDDRARQRRAQSIWPSTAAERERREDSRGVMGACVGDYLSRGADGRHSGVQG
jgi:hypothetical protein